MNILFFLKPKSTITILKEEFTLRQVVETMEHSGFTALPIINEAGIYIGTLCEKDLLSYFKEIKEFNLKDLEKVSLKSIKRCRDNLPIRIDEDMNNLIHMAKKENFVPVIDDRYIFIGIITRQDIIDYFFQNYVKGNNNE